MKVRILNGKLDPLPYTQTQDPQKMFTENVELYHVALVFKTNLIRIIVNESTIEEGQDHTQIEYAIDQIPDQLYHTVVWHVDKVLIDSIATNIYYRLRLSYPSNSLISLESLKKYMYDQATTIHYATINN